MGGGGRSCEIDGWILVGGKVGLIVRGIGWNDFLFFCFSAGWRWILWAVNDVAKVVGRRAYIYSYVQK